MLITLIRVLILYVLIIICMRLMGKRQLGELQPTELVITILLSEIASIPIQDNGVPLISSVMAVLLLVGGGYVARVDNVRDMPLSYSVGKVGGIYADSLSYSRLYAVLL